MKNETTDEAIYRAALSILDFGGGELPNRKKIEKFWSGNVDPVFTPRIKALTEQMAEQLLTNP